MGLPGVRRPQPPRPPRPQPAGFAPQRGCVVTHTAVGPRRASAARAGTTRLPGRGQAPTHLKSDNAVLSGEK